MNQSRLRAVLLGCCLALAGCTGSQSNLRSRIPKRPDKFAREFLDVLFKEEFEDAQGMITAPLRPGDIDKDGNQEIKRLLSQGGQADTRAVGAHQFVFDRSGANLRTTLDYQIQFEKCWLVVTVDVETRDDEQAIANLRVNKLDVPLEEQNVLSFAGLKLGQYVFFGVGCAILLVTLIAAITCLVSRGSRKTLWILLILVGFGSVRMNWTTGERRYDFLTLQFPSVHVSQPNPYAPWTVSLGAPLGVALFMLHRRRLKGRVPAAPAKPARAAAPTAPEPTPEPAPPAPEPEPEAPEPPPEEPEDAAPREEGAQ
jgi:hypothetical protein